MILSIVVLLDPVVLGVLVGPIVPGAARHDSAGSHMGRWRLVDSPTQAPRPDGPSGPYGTGGTTRIIGAYLSMGGGGA